MRRMNSNVAATSPSGSGGLPSTNENSGTTPNSRMRRASSSVSDADALPPLFMRASAASLAASAPEKSIFSPERTIARHVASL